MWIKPESVLEMQLLDTNSQELLPGSPLDVRIPVYTTAGVSIGFQVSSYFGVVKSLMDRKLRKLSISSSPSYTASFALVQV